MGCQPVGSSGGLGQARWAHCPGSKGCLCMEGWLAGSQPWAPAHASEVGVSVHPMFVQLPGSAGLTLPVPWLSPCRHWRRDWCPFPSVRHQPLTVREGTWLSLSVPFAVSLIPAEAGAAVLPRRVWRREDNPL